MKPVHMACVHCVKTYTPLSAQYPNLQNLNHNEQTSRLLKNKIVIFTSGTTAFTSPGLIYCMGGDMQVNMKRQRGMKGEKTNKKRKNMECNISYQNTKYQRLVTDVCVCEQTLCASRCPKEKSDISLKSFCLSTDGTESLSFRH